MNSNDLKIALQGLKYPGIDSTIGELKLLGEIKVVNGVANVELLTISDESYLNVKKLIEDNISDKFDSLNIIYLCKREHMLPQLFSPYHLVLIQS